MVKFELTKAGAPTCDFETAKQELTERTAQYTNVVFTEETKTDAKKLVAELRKEKKAIEDDLKKIKAEYLKPWNAFNEQVTELLGLYDAPIYNINEQVEAFELKRKQEKQELCRGIYAELVTEPELLELIPFDRIRNSKWDNATFKENAIRVEIIERKTEAKQALATIKAMQSDKEAEALEAYKRTFNIADAIGIITRYEAEKREIMERERERQAAEAEKERARQQAELEERIRAEERAKIEAEKMQQAELEAVAEAAKEEAVAQLIPEQTDEAPADYTYILTMTSTEKDTLERYMNSIGLAFTELTI